MATASEDRLFELRPSAWLNRFEYAFIGLMTLLALLAYGPGFGAGLALLILLLALRWRLSGQLLLPHRQRIRVGLVDQPPRLICYACRFDDDSDAWPLQRVRLLPARHFLVLLHGRRALLIVADRFESAAEHARFRRRLFQLMENHAR